MKSFNQILSEVSQPKSEDERVFKDKHLVQVINHPVADNKQHTGDIDGDEITDRPKKHKRKADYKKGEDRLVYEEIELDDDDLETRFDRERRAEIKQKIYDEAKKLDPVGQEDDDIDNDGDVDSSDSYLHNRRKAVTAAIRKKFRKESSDAAKIDLNEKAVSQAQQKAAAIALAVKKGKLPKSKLQGASKDMYGMSVKDLEDFAKTKLRGLPVKMYEGLDEAVTVNKKNYSWGKMITVHHGSSHSFPLHPEHQEKIRKLEPGQKTAFKDETGSHITAHRDGDTIHLKHPGSNKKTSVARSHFTESVELDENTIPYNIASALQQRHYGAAEYHKKKGNMKGYKAHFDVANKIEDAMISAGQHAPVRSKRIEAASDKAFREHPHKMHEEVELDEGNKENKIKKNKWARHLGRVALQNKPLLKKSGIKVRRTDPSVVNLRLGRAITQQYREDTNETYKLDEAAEVSHDRYMRSHGKKARDTGHPGTWMFTHKSMGDVDYNDDKEVHTAHGKFSDAKKSAQQWAKLHGHRTIYVMEDVGLDEARKSSSYQFTHKPGDPESEKKLSDLKASIKGTGKRVVLQGRLGKNNPNAHKYSKSAPRAQYVNGKRVNSDVSGKSGGHTHQRIQKADAAHHDVYVYDRNESVELNELSPNTLHSYIKKAAGNMAGNAAVAAAQASSSMKKSSPEVKRNIRNRMRGITSASGRLADKANMAEEIEQVDELKKSTLGSYIKKASKRAVSDKVTADRLSRRAFDAKDRDDAEKYFDASDRTQKKYKNRLAGIEKATDRLTKEETDLTENFKTGSIKLNDGSNILLKDQDAKLLNQLFKDLNSENKKKMMKVAMTDKNGFNEILGFAREAL